MTPDFQKEFSSPLRDARQSSFDFGTPSEPSGEETSLLHAENRRKEEKRGTPPPLETFKEKESKPPPVSPAPYYKDTTEKVTPEEAASERENRPLERIEGVGEKTAKRLEAMGLRDLSDFLLWLPTRYEDHTRIVPIANLQTGRDALICGVVHNTKIWGRNKRRQILVCSLRDASGEISLMYFNYAQYTRSKFPQGARMLCFGKVQERRPTDNQSSPLTMMHPVCKRVPGDEPPPLEKTLTPIYRAGEGVSQKLIRNLVSLALERKLSDFGDLLLAGTDSDEYATHLKKACMGKEISLEKAILTMHRPPPGESPLNVNGTAYRRLAFEELLAWQIAVRQARDDTGQQTACPMGPNLTEANLTEAGITGTNAQERPLLDNSPREKSLREKFLENLPFTPTSSQLNAIAEIDDDLAKSKPMMRLLQGDVGCGKTVVLAAAATACAEAGLQTAIMAPTELLSQQHMRTISEWLNPLGIETAWLSGAMPVAKRRTTLAAIANGSAKVICGTHALFSERVEYRSLGLVIMDEQHRFGVHHRLALLQKNKQDQTDPENAIVPHQLISTATPIPRSLAMTFYAGTDFTTIPEMPPGRQPVNTVMVESGRRAKVIERVAKVCGEGQQAYWVCPLIEESEAVESQAVTTVLEELKKAFQGAPAPLCAAGVHGRTKAKERDRIMSEFVAGKINVLVATTIVEVGVDVPGASLMIIENAERMGLAQLHQLRGRVGRRGGLPSHCVLLYRYTNNEVAMERLKTMKRTSDGFEIARKDLSLRGPGETFSVRQTGANGFRIANPERDFPLLESAREIALTLGKKDPEKAKRISERWVNRGPGYARV